MATINMTQTCKQNGIDSFSRTRGGWMKLVEGYDNTQYGGYRFVGSNFVKVGNYDTELSNGLYLDCSKPLIDGEKQEIMNLFSIKDGEVELLDTIPKSTRGWANTFEKTVIEYFVGEGITSLEILETVKDMTCNRDVLHDVGRALLKEERGRVWLNEAHFSAFMQEASVYNAEFELSRDKVQEMAVNLHHNDFEARRYFHDEIDDEYQLHMLYSLIHASPQFRDYIDYDVVYEDIPEDYYTSISNLEELRKENSNLLPLTKGKAFDDKGYWVSFNHRYYSDRKTIYIIIPNAVEEKIIIKSFDMMLR